MFPVFRLHVDAVVDPAPLRADASIELATFARQLNPAGSLPRATLAFRRLRAGIAGIDHYAAPRFVTTIVMFILISIAASLLI